MAPWLKREKMERQQKWTESTSRIRSIVGGGIDIPGGVF